MNKSTLISHTLTFFIALSTLASAAFVGCAKPNDKQNKAPVRGVKDKNPDAPVKPEPGTPAAAAENQLAVDNKLRNIGFDIQVLNKAKPSFRDHFKLSSDETGKLAIHCVSSLAEMSERDLQSGLILLGKSSVSLIKSKTEAAPEDKKLFVNARCELPQDEKKEEGITEEFKIEDSVPLTVGASESLKILIEKEGATEKSAVANFGCSDKIENSPFKIKNKTGINLEKGSSVVVVQNTKVEIDPEKLVSNETAKAASEQNKKASLKLTLIQCR